MTSTKPCALCGRDAPDALLDYVYEDKRVTSHGAGYQEQTLRYNLTLAVHISCKARSSRQNRTLGAVALLGSVPLLLLILAKIITPESYTTFAASLGDLPALTLGAGMLLTLASGGIGLIVIP